jgi:hypothetical protein
VCTAMLHYVCDTMKRRVARRTLDEEDYKQGTKAKEIMSVVTMTDNRLHVHDKASPAADVCVSFNLRIL